MQFPHTRRALLLVSPLGLSSAIFAMAILAGYLFGVEPLYRPLGGGPATHPLTAISLALLGAGIFVWRPRYPRPLVSIPAGAVLAISLLRLTEIGFDADLLGYLTPFAGVLDAAGAAGKPIAIGANTAAMAALLSVALILNSRRRFAAAQVVAFIAIGFPLVSITGYAYGLEKFHGRMALTTVIAALPVAFAILLANAHRGVLRAILSPWVGGRIARVQILLGYAVPFAIGYALLITAARHPAELFGLFVVMISAFISGLIAFSAVFQEKVDRSRRSAERQLAVAATHDPLTDLPNRRVLMEIAQREWNRAGRHGSPLAVLMLDIDHFKLLNDRHGHAVGDQVLTRVAETMRDSLRAQDLAVRYGGEEFVVLLPDTAISGARLVAESLRLRIARETQVASDLGSPAVTVSIGIADNRQSDDFHHMLCRADAALYLAKSSGRNRVEAAPEELPDLAPAPI